MNPLHCKILGYAYAQKYTLRWSREQSCMTSYMLAWCRRRRSLRIWWRMLACSGSAILWRTEYFVGLRIAVHCSATAHRWIKLFIAHLF